MHAAKLTAPILAVTAVLSAQVSVTTHHNDLSRTGQNLQEVILNTSNVNVSTFGKLFSRPVDAQIYAQPLYVSGVVIPGQGTHNVVYVATENNSVYAFDADAPGATTPLWQVNLGSPILSSVIDATRNIIPQIGITSTPVIDPSSNTIYVVAETYENSQAIFRLHALDITTGAEKFNGPTVIQGSVQGTGYDAVNGVVTFNALMLWQRPGLLLWGGNVYIGFGSHLDADPYHGWIFGYSATTLKQTAVYCTTPNGQEGGVWQGGAALALDSATGYLYATVGNGTMDANTGLRDYGDTILKLDTSSNLAVADYFSPFNQNALSNADVDLGSAGALLIPGTTLGVGGGKEGTVYVFNRNNLGQYNSSVDQLPQEWQATYSFLQTGDAGFFGGPVFYNSQLYEWGQQDTLKQYAFNGSTFNTTPVQGPITIPTGYSDEPAMSISANGTAAGSAILWAAYSTSGDTPNGGALPGILVALDASNVTHELWDSNQNQSRDYSGSWSKWTPPTVANGKVYLATFDNVLNVYGLFSTGSSGSLAGAGDSSAASVNLTAEGGADWIHWGDGILNRKAGVSPQLSTYTTVPVGGGAASSYGNDPRPVSWTDGTPTTSSSNNTDGMYLAGVGQGFSVQAPADTTTRTLIVHVGGFASAGTLTASLSDNSAANFTDVTSSATGQYDRNYTLTYHAGSAGQALTVTWVMSSGSGNVTLNGAALSGASTPALAASGGTPQTTTVSTAFASALQATVTNGGNPVSGVTVTFTAPGSGASGTFSGGSTTASVTTGSSGIAVARTFTASSKAGSYVVTATAGGVAGSVGFSLTNTVGPAANVAASAGNSQSATINTAFATELQATVTDSGGNPVSGVSVKFAAPGSGASGTFTGGSTTASVTTASSGIALAPAFTANGVAGSYTLSASVAGLSGTASFNLTNTASTGNGSLSGTVTGAAAAVNLTAEGSVDWVHWGDGSLDRKAGVTPQLSTYSTIPSGTANTYNNDPRLISWTDGTPTASSTNNTNGVYVWGVGHGFSIQAPADTTMRTLIVHVGGWASGGTLRAQLSDGSAANFSDVTTTANGQYDRNYTLTYTASRAGQTLTVTWVMSSGSGNVTLNAAALSGASTAALAASGGTPQTTTVSTAFATALQAAVTNGGSPVSGVTVTFTAPGSGASGTFAGGSTTASVTSGSNGIAAAPTFTANSKAGSYAVTATASGVAGTASFSLTNTAGSAVNIAASAGNSQSATVGTAFVITLQATVTDSGGNPVNGVTVMFTAPASGASGTFAGGSTAASIPTGSNGIAVAPMFTANSQSGTYTVMANVSGVSLPAGFTLTNTASSGTGWYNLAWSWRKPLTINHALVSGGSSLTGFPVLFSVTDPNLATAANGGGTGKADGTDILFTASDGVTKLNHEIESYNPATGQTVAWVQVPSLSPATDTLIYVYYGNPSAPNEQNIAGSWDSNYLAVYHMANDAPTTLVTDSTGANNGAATANTNVSTIAGEVGSALFLNGDTDQVTVPQNGNFNLDAHPFTLESWVRDDSNPANLVTFHRVMSWYDGVNNIQLGLGQDATATQRSFYLMNAPTSALPAVVSAGNAPTGFNHVAVTFDGAGTYHIYVNGVISDGGSLKPGLVTAMLGSPASLYLGQRGDGNNATYLSGVLDETRISNTARSPGWISTEYNNQSSPGMFVSSGQMQCQQPGNTLAASGGTPQTATVGMAFATALQVAVTSGGNPVSGVTVTFAAPASGASGTFAGGSTTASVTAGSNGIAVAPAFTANSTAGSYAVTGSASGVVGTANFSLTNQAAVGSGSLTGTATSSASAVNLTAEGTSDWEHWGPDGVNRKAGVSPQLGPAVTAIQAFVYNNDPRPVSWTDGTPTGSSTNNTGGYYVQQAVGQGFTLQAPADTTMRTLVVHVGGWNSGGTLTAQLSDGSAANYTDVTAAVSGQYDRNYTLTYNAATAGQTLTVSWVVSTGSGNVTLNAAALH